jgi:hypothetical protein
MVMVCVHDEGKKMETWTCKLAEGEFYVYPLYIFVVL